MPTTFIIQARNDNDYDYGYDYDQDYDNLDIEESF